MSQNIEGLQLCSRFAFRPNQLRLCGRDSAIKMVYACITQGECLGLEDEFSKFKAMYPYLLTISSKAEKDLFDPEVIEAYWIGNDLLRTFAILIQRFKDGLYLPFSIKPIV